MDPRSFFQGYGRLFEMSGWIENRRQRNQGLRCCLGRMQSQFPPMLHESVDQAEQSLSSLSARVDRSEIGEINTIMKCQFCSSIQPKYSCPKCNALYCGLKCYRSPRHSECSEKFYKDCVKQELELRSSESADNATKEQMVQTLQKVMLFQPHLW